MGKPIELLSHSIFEKTFMDSKVKTKELSKSERILGHLIGPLGLIFVVNTIAALVEKFFTQQTGAMYGTENVAMIQQMGGQYEIVMTVAKLLAVALGLVNGWLIQHTKSRQGRMRPWYLIFGFVSIIIGFLIFLFPGNTLGESYWFYFFALLIAYHTVGSTYFYLFRDTICSLTTRDEKEKTQIQFIRKMSWTLLSGIVIGMVVNMVVLPMWLEHDIKGYAILLVGLSAVAIPLLLLEYFYTKERITEDVNATKDATNNIPLKDQMKALLTNRYFVIFMVLMTVAGVVDSFKGGNVQYFYIKYLLDGENNPFMYTLYQIITGIPLGVGAIIAYPISRKFGIRNFAMAGYVLVLIGSVLGWMFPSNLTIAMVAGFMRQMGMIPNAYIFATLLCFAYDSVEHKSGIRMEGLMGVAIITAIQAAINAPFAGGYESTILRMGFVDVVGVTPSAEVVGFMTLAFYLFDIILAVFNLVLLPFMDVEKKMPQITADLEARKQNKEQA